MSNYDLMWNAEQRAVAAKEGWELGLVVDEGKPVSSAYMEVFDRGPLFKDRVAAMRFVVHQARQQSKLHVDALSVVMASRTKAPPKTRKKT